MRKLTLSIALITLLGLGLISCDRDARKCYKFTYEVEILGVKTEVSTYEWCSANEADAKKDFSFVENMGFYIQKEKIYKTNKHVFLRKYQ